MMKLYFIAVLAMLTVSVNAQIEFEKTYGGPGSDEGMSVRQTKDGGYILFGQSDSYGKGAQDMMLIKTDASGNQQWYKTYGTSNYDFGISAQQTSDGGYILCGSVSGIGNDSLTLIKTDANGNETWNKQYPGVFRSVGQFVQETSDNGFIAVGNIGPGGSEDIYVVKTDASGKEAWSKIYSYSGRQFGESVYQMKDGGYAIFGETNGKGNGGTDMFLLRINNIGDTLWTKEYGTSAEEVGQAMYPTTDKGFVLLGYRNDVIGNLYLVKTDSTGKEQWSTLYTQGGRKVGNSVQQTIDGGYILAGQMQDSIMTGTAAMYCIKADNNGNKTWSRTFPKGIYSAARSVEQTTDGGFIFLGYGLDSLSGTTDMLLVKTDANGLMSVVNNVDPEMKIVAYPNPFTASTTLYFENERQEKIALSLYSVEGKLVGTIENNSDRIKVERNELSPGIYFYRLTKADGAVGRGKLIVE